MNNTLRQLRKGWSILQNDFNKMELVTGIAAILLFTAGAMI